jgi:hypothetical protein
MSLGIISKSDTHVAQEVDLLIDRLSPFYKDEQLSDWTITVVSMTLFEVDVLPERVIANAIRGSEYNNKIPFREIHRKRSIPSRWNWTTLLRFVPVP